MKSLKLFLTASFVLLLFTLLFTQSCSDISIPVNQNINNAQQGDRLCSFCWLIVNADLEGQPVTNAKVVVKYNNNSYLEGMTDSYGICSFYTQGLGLPSSPPDWLAIVDKEGYNISGDQWYSWDGYSYMTVYVHCISWE